MRPASSKDPRAQSGEPPDAQAPAAQSGGAHGKTRADLLAAAESCLRRDGHAELSTRRIAQEARVPLSQIHYHFGSKQGLLLALLEHLNARLLERQAAAFVEPMSLSRRWDRACDFLEEDLASGYVRILQDMIAAGWSDPEIAAAVRRDLRGWFVLITALATESAERFGGLGPFDPAEVAALVGAAFLGSEELLLLGLEGDAIPVRAALRKLGALIRQAELNEA